MRKHLRRKSDNKKITQLVVMIVIVLLIGLILPPSVRFIGMVVLYPVQLFDTWLEQSSMVVPVLWRDKIAMQEEISTLQQEVAELSRRSLTEQRLVQENKQLRNLLSNTAATRTVAAVVAKPTELPYDLLQIDQGSLAGIEVGAPVYIGYDSVIGLVSSVYLRHAFVTLFTTPDFEVTAFITGPNVITTLEGLGGGVARVKVPQGVRLQVNDLVHVPSIQPGVYGRIAWIESEPTQPEQYGYITPEIPINSLFQLAVGSPSTISVQSDDLAAHIQMITSQALRWSDTLVGSTTATSSDDVATSSLSASS